MPEQSGDEKKMSADIYYFSGTGNSLFIAKGLAQRLGGSLKTVSSAIDNNVTRADADTVGVVFPVYYTELPVIIKRFAGMLDTEGRYVFAVCNFGGSAGHSLKILKGIIEERGGSLSAAFGVHMPQNAFHKPWEDKDSVYAQSAKRLDFIADRVGKHRCGMFYTNIPLEIMMRPLHGVVQRACRKDFSKRTGMPEGAPMDELIHLLDGSFKANERCTGCGTCARVCPVSNIRIEDGRPKWLGHCENCLACFNWCPVKAISGGVSQGYYYRHPDITLSEMAAKRS